MKKNGFTLAEVLISLGIVGVIAAITLPSLFLSVEKQKIGPSLMKVINTLEVANSVALQQESVVSLADIHVGETTGAGYLDGILSNYTKLVDMGGGVYATKDGITLKKGTTEAEPKPGTAPDKRLTGSYYTVEVDINGDKDPNMIGKDQFTLYVDTSGVVLAPGSKLAKDYADKVSLWTATGDNQGCPSISKTSKVAPGDPRSCAGSIVDNGGKLLYYYEGVTAPATSN